MTRRRFLVTAALPYANGKLHVGHIAGAYLPSDIYVRYLRSRGDEVAFICGSDDHGVPILLTALKEGCTPREVIDRYHAAQDAAFKGLGILFDVYGKTMSDGHVRLSREFFQKVHANGYLKKKETDQLYDPVQQMFLPDRYVKGTCHYPDCRSPDALGDQCEKCGRTIDPLKLVDPVSVVSGARPEIRKTSHWYFDLPRLAPKLQAWIEGHPEWRPVVRNFSLGIIKDGLPERAMTRDLDWGVPVPLADPDAKGKVLYVWFDAPIGYVSFTAEIDRDWTRWWKDPACKIVHFIGEDNIVFHAVIWPGMLMAEGSFQLPSNVVANCFLNIQFPGHEEEKQSKSRGTAVWVEDALEHNEADALRYYLTLIAPENQQTAYRPDELVTRTNDELVAALGNFIHRSIVFAHKYTGGKVPPATTPGDAEREQLASIGRLAGRVGEALEAFQFKNALGILMAEARQANKFFDSQAPWESRKKDMARCETTIHVCLATVRALGTVMAPFLPFGAEKVRKILGLEPAEFGWAKAGEPLAEGRPLGAAEILWKKIDVEKEGKS